MDTILHFHSVSRAAENLVHLVIVKNEVQRERDEKANGRTFQRRVAHSGQFCFRSCGNELIEKGILYIECFVVKGLLVEVLTEGD